MINTNNFSLESSMREFYDFLYSKNVVEFVASTQFTDLKNQMESGFKILSQKTNDFSNTENEKLVELLLTSTYSEFQDIFLVLRILTTVSRMNMITFFISELCSKQIFQPKIKLKKNKPDGRQIEFNAITYAMPTYEKLVELIYQNKELVKELLNFFKEKGLDEKLIAIKGRNMMDVLALSEILLKFSEKGQIAEKSGEAAETIIKTKLKQWGLTEEIDFNKNDEDINDILKIKLDFLKQRNDISHSEFLASLKIINETKKSRRFDLVFPPTSTSTINEPHFLIQTVFYTSNTGSEGKKKTNQNIDTTNFISEVLPRHHNEIKTLLILDGPGWIDMAGAFQKNQYTSDNFVQINTIDTKLKKILNDHGFVFPIDVDIAIYELQLMKKGHTMNDILEFMSTKPNIHCSDSKIISQNSKHFATNLQDDEIKLICKIDIVKKYLVLEKIMNCDNYEKPTMFTVKSAGSLLTEISDNTIFKKLVPQCFSKQELLTILDILEMEGSIIRSNI